MTTLIGTNPDQVPVNSMLGGMAYQDPDSVSVKDLSSSGTANITDVSYSGTLTGGTGIINIGSGQVYKDASGNVGLGIVPSGNKLAIAGTGYVFKISASGTQYNGLGVQCTDASGSNARNVFYDVVNESGATVANMVGDINTDGSSGWSWETQSPGARTDRRSVKMRLSGIGDLALLGTGATKLQEGTTAERPATPQEGMLRKNSTLNMIEGYVGGEWKEVVTVPATSGVIGRFQSVSGVNLAGTGLYELLIDGTVTGVNKIEITFQNVSSNGVGDIFFDIGSSTGGYSPGNSSVFLSEQFDTATFSVSNSAASSVTPSNRLRLTTSNDVSSVLSGKIIMDKHIQNGGAHCFVVTASIREYRSGSHYVSTGNGFKHILFTSDSIRIKLVAEGNQFDSGSVSINAYTLY